MFNPDDFPQDPIIEFTSPQGEKIRMGLSEFQQKNPEWVDLLGNIHRGFAEDFPMKEELRSAVYNAKLTISFIELEAPDDANSTR